MSHKPQLFSGARALISYENSAGKIIPMAIATDVSVNTRDNIRPSFVVGQLGPISLEPLSIDVDCSIGRLIPMNGAGKTGDETGLPGRQPSEDGPPGDLKGKSLVTAMDLGLEERINQILTADSIKITIVDSITNKTIAVVREARFSGRSMSLNSSDIGNERMNFVGIYDSGYDNKNTSETTGYTDATVKQPVSSSPVVV